MKSIPFFSLTDIKRDFDPDYFARGAAYQKEKRVTHLETGHDKHGHWKIKSTIQGAGENIYQTDIIITFKDGTFGVDGYCSCPMDHNCKHVAASLIEAISQQNLLAQPTVVREATRETPTPVFRIMTNTVRFKVRPWSIAQEEKKFLAHLSFAYTEGTIPHTQKVEESTISRNLEAEQEILSHPLMRQWKNLGEFAHQIDPFTLEMSNLIFDVKTPSAHASWTDEAIIQTAMVLSNEVFPHLKTEGWQIETDPSFPFQPIQDIGEWYANVNNEATSGIDWFDLEMGVEIDGKRINILPHIVRLLRNPNIRTTMDNDNLSDEEVIYTQLDDGRYLPIPAKKIQFIARTLIELYDLNSLTQEGRLRLSTWQSAQLAELEHAMAASQLRWFGSNQLRDLGNKLRDFKMIEKAILPVSFHNTLRPYQEEGVSWLQFLRDHNLNGILADDMGLGKTIQALAHIMVEKESGRMQHPILVVAPTSLMTNWKSEASRFAPILKVLILQGNERKDNFDRIADHDLILTTYPLLSRDKDILLNHKYHLLILDEAQVIKNPNTMAHRIVQQVQAKHRLCLTGTPMENHLGELWSLFHFLMPGFLGDNKKFTQTFRKPIEKRQDQDRQLALTRRVRPFMLRRTKEEVVSELPAKTEIIQHIELLPTQRDLYESVRLAMHSKIQVEIEERGLKRSQIVILDALLKMRQVCCDPRLLKIESAKNVKESAKLQFLIDTLPEMIEENRKILLFSQFTSMLALIEAELKKLKIPYVILTGQTKDRQTPINDFQSGKVPLFLISLKAGGTGLNLTAADTVIHYDPWWNPAVENQATDRAYRIGQNKPVFVYKLVTVGTVEEKILDMQNYKAALFAGVFDGTSTSSGSLSPEDLEALFEPLP
ncbi:MAG: SNF2-related protein [Candidatus Paracaedibacter sp.]